MSNKQALPIFSTSKIDHTTVDSLRRTRAPAATHRSKEMNSPVTPKLIRKDAHLPSSQIRNRCKSTPNIPEKRQVSSLSTPLHSCSPSLSPKSTKRYCLRGTPIRRVYSENSLDNSAASLSEEIQNDETSNFVVGVRVRPFNTRELDDKLTKKVVTMSVNEVQLTCQSGTTHTFTYDHCLWSFDYPHSLYASQKTVFETMVRPLLDQLLLGYNACLLAYGQTGSGKSYSMMGVPGNGAEPGDEAGVIPRFCHQLFEKIKPLKDGTCVEISYYEIYNEKIHDLLAGHVTRGVKTPLRVREHPDLGPYIVGLAVHGVNSYLNVKEWLTVGNSQRVTAATGMNEKSSRSHSIFSVLVTQQTEEGSTRRSRINLVDLAGSERVAQTCATGTKLKEGVSINKSLLSLGKVITFLSERSRKKGFTSFGPYRESVLTWLLRESLGGNSQTAMLATISPANTHLDETLATLRYACQARCIVNRVHKNEDPNERFARELQARMEKIAALEGELERVKLAAGSESVLKKQEEINELRRKLKEVEEKVQQEHLSWEEKLKAAEHRKSIELQHLKRCGVAVELNLNAKQACLINLSADPILTGTLLYLLPAGKVIVGSDNDCDIVLEGPLIENKLCAITNNSPNLSLTPLKETAEIFLNGHQVTKPCNLIHGDRLVFGDSHYFRVHAPEQGKVDKKVIDFEMARGELLREREKKLRGELEGVLREAEAERSQHARQLQDVMDVLEAQTGVLEKERRVKQELEIERSILQSRITQQKPEEELKISPYESSFLEEMKGIFNPLGETKIRHHEMQLMVREATRKCSDLGLTFEFSHEQLIDENGLESVIKINDATKQVFTHLKTTEFLNFLNQLRENPTKDTIETFLNNSKLIWDKEGKKKRNSKRISFSTIFSKENIDPTKNGTNHSQPEQISKLTESLLKALQKDPAIYKEVLSRYQMFLEALQNAQKEESSKSVRFYLNEA